MGVSVMSGGVSATVVQVRFESGQLTVQPERAAVKVGGLVEWRVSGSSNLTWTIYFDHGSPFSSAADDTTGTSGTITLGPPLEPGDFKYGVRVSDPQTKATLADDDPWLIVRD
jgi:hypothetical protein